MLIFAFCFVFVYMSLWGLFAILKKDNTFADLAWGSGIALLALMSFVFFSDFNWGQALLTTLVCIWGGRLTIHIFKRHHGKAEDRRYAAWRKDWKKKYGADWKVNLRSFLQVFMLQGFLQIVLALPLLIVNGVSDLRIRSFHTYAPDEYGGNMMFYEMDPLLWLLCLGLGVWLVGFFFEVLGDFQLTQFVKTKKKGEIMQTGLWKFTRHPNYFGEVTQWWGVFLVAASLIEFGPLVFVALLSPLSINLLIYFVSGIPLLEKKYEGQKNWEVYAKRTSKFIPWFPKS